MEKIGIGSSAPVDTEDRITVTLQIEDGTVMAASFTAAGCEALADCGRTLCAILPGKPADALWQMTNMAIVYNMEPPLPVSRFYCSQMAAAAAKNALRDYCQKNGLPYTPACHCGGTDK